MLFLCVCVGGGFSHSHVVILEKKKTNIRKHVVKKKTFFCLQDMFDLNYLWCLHPCAYISRCYIQQLLIFNNELIMFRYKQD